MPEAIIIDNADQFKAEKEQIAADAARRELAVPKAERSTFDNMLAAARDIDIEKIRQLQNMHERAQDREAERLFSEDFAIMQPKLPRVIKLKDNAQTKSKYAPLEDINKAINPILEAHGFGLSAKTLDQTADGVKVEVSLRHKAGHKESTVVYMPLDDKGMAGSVNKTKPHAHSSSIMYARRVGECMLLNISTGDDLDGNLPGGSITEEDAVALAARVDSFEPDYRQKFLDYMKVKTIEEIAAKDLQKANKAIDAKAERSKAGAK